LVVSNPAKHACPTSSAREPAVPHRPQGEHFFSKGHSKTYPQALLGLVEL